MGKQEGGVDLYASKFVLDEAKAGDHALAQRRLKLLEDIPVLALKSGKMELAEDLVHLGALPGKAAIDALHIAAATVYGCDYLLTWNCRHIATPKSSDPFEQWLPGAGSTCR